MIARAGCVPNRPDPADPVALARALIACRTVTPEAGPALAVLEDALAGEGFKVERAVFREPGTADVENLHARAGAAGPVVALAGHVDVVPAGDPAQWRHPPFAGVVEDGMLHGRGAVDMKGGLAAMVAAAVRHRRAGRGGGIAFLVTGDEEGPSVNGTRKLLDWCADRGERFDAALVGEPTSRARLGDTVKVGRRGTLSGEVTVRGRQGHVAYPERAMNPIPPLLAVARALLDPPLDAGTAAFAPSNLEIVSVDVGNTALNVIPAEARLAFNVRFTDRWTIPDLSAEIRRRIGAAAGGADAEIAFLRPAQAFLTEPGPLLLALEAAVEAVAGIVPERSTGGGTSDARFIKDHAPVVEFGPVGDTMHQANERVPVADLEALAAIYEEFLARFLGGAGR